jgi:hypothetical protein
VKPAVIALAVAIAVVAYAFTRYPGSGLVFVLFNVCFAVLVALMVPQPRLYVYTFLAAFLALGFWLKVVFHAIWAPGFVEPVGDFAGTPAQWDGALIASSFGAMGLIAARLGHLWHVRKRPAATQNGAPAAAPQWFIRWRAPIWILTVLIVIGVNAVNLQFAFFQIGVKPKLILPLRIHVLLGWLVNIGLALWVASLVWWDYKQRRALGRTLFVPLGESLLAAVSSFSRMNFLLHALPYALVIWERRKELSGFPQRRWLGILGAGVLLFVVSVVAVFWLREVRYYKPAERNVLGTMATQLPLLVVHRWIGLEGVLAVGAAGNRGTALFLAALTEDPKLGDRSLFQRIAKANVRYTIESEKLIFLSNAGPIAVLLFSGSLAIALAGMALIGAVLVLTEELTRRLTGNPFLLAVSGAALANVVSQTTFFYLSLIFLAQLWVAVGFLAAVQRVDFSNSREGQ